MAIEFRCSQCNQLLRVPEDSVGKNARCPKCQSLMTVPAASQPAASQPGAGQPSAPLAGGGAPFSPLPSHPGHPPVPPKPANDPFSFLNQPGGGAGGAMPPPPPGNPFAGLGAPQPPKPAGNPFGDGGYSQASTNPYAAPAGGYGYSYQPGYGGPTGPRPGLPWEQRPNSAASWWETTRLVMLDPTLAFRSMRQTGGIGSPMVYALLGQGIGFVAQLIWLIPFQLIIGLMNEDGMEMAMVQIVFNVVFGLVGVVAGATIGLFIGAAMQHLALRIVGGANQPYETTFRVLAFVQGSFAWLNIIPIAGPLVGAIWAIVAMIIGQANAHECSPGKAVGAFFLSLLLGCVIIFAIYILIILVVLAIVAAIAGAAGAAGG